MASSSAIGGCGDSSPLHGSNGSGDGSASVDTRVSHEAGTCDSMHRGLWLGDWEPCEILMGPHQCDNLDKSTTEDSSR